MAIVADTEPRDKLTCTQALTTAYDLAVAALPADTHGRLAKALTLVQAGQVFETDQGHWEVPSQSEGGAPHSVNGACDCAWAHFHPGNRCTHQLAVLLQRKALVLLQTAHAAPVEVPAPATLLPASPAVPAPPLYEAPASVNVKVQVAGREYMITLRDADEDRLLARLEWVLQRYPLPAPSPPAATETAPRCPEHGALKQGKRGWYCPRKVATGQWCPYRTP